MLDTFNPHARDLLPRIPQYWSFTIRRNLTITGRTSARWAFCTDFPFGRYLNGKLKHYVVCGIQMHSSLAVTTDGLPLGLTAMKFWTRSKFIGCNALKKKINPTRVPIEKKESIRWLENLEQSTALLNDPERCVHIGDRESDIYELFCRAETVGTHFLVRTCVDRLAGDGKHTIADEMREVRIQGLHRIQVMNEKGHPSEAILEIRYRRIRVLPPIGKQKQYPELMLTVIHAQERGAPKGRERIDWKLITDLPVRSRDEAIEKLKWYSMRWKIETFHKILKSGCKAEESRLRTAQRLTNLIAVFCILSWRIFWLTMMNRAVPDALPTLAFTALEIRLLDQLTEVTGTQRPTNKITFNLPDQGRETRGLSRTRRRCSPRKHGHLERPVPLDRHRVGLRARS